MLLGLLLEVPYITHFLEIVSHVDQLPLLASTFAETCFSVLPLQLLHRVYLGLVSKALPLMIACTHVQCRKVLS